MSGQFTFIKFPSKLTSYIFFTEILSQLNFHFTNLTQNKIIFDFSDVERINPLALPNLLITGSQIKNYYGAPVPILLPWKPKLLAYLSDTGFLTLNNKLSIFAIDEGVLGGFESGIYNEASIHHFHRGEIVDKSDISLKLRKSLNVLELAFKDRLTVNENKIDKILLLFEEIIWNAIVHGESDCFACLQSNIGRGTGFKKAYVSISDGGKGFLRSLLTKTDSGYIPKFVSPTWLLNNKHYCNLAAILEAIFYRQTKEVFGIYDIIRMVSKENGTVRIHTENTQLVLTPNSLPDDHDPENILSHFISACEQGQGRELKYSSVRISKEKLHGVHYELEIPLSAEGTL
jgi:hypothetical protein